MTPSEAHQIWSNAMAKKDERVAEIINMIIKSNPEGLPCILNRNPTINYGSVLAMYCVGFTDTLTISVPLQVLKPLGADQLTVKVPFYSDIDCNNTLNCLGYFNTLAATA